MRHTAGCVKTKESVVKNCGHAGFVSQCATVNAVGSGIVQHVEGNFGVDQQRMKIVADASDGYISSHG